MTAHEWEADLERILDGFTGQVRLAPGMLLVIGCSTSEVAGEKIGTAGSKEAARVIYSGLLKLQRETGIDLAFQCCEHLNRALVVERDAAARRNLEEVAAIPVRNAGGAMAAYAFEQMEDPVLVEAIRADAGMDIGSTLIGMHLRPVAVPVRVPQKTLGKAAVILATTRPKLIGGARAVYERIKENESC